MKNFENDSVCERQATKGDRLSYGIGVDAVSCAFVSHGHSRARGSYPQATSNDGLSHKAGPCGYFVTMGR
jgi:hypothetical protein